MLANEEEPQWAPPLWLLDFFLQAACQPSPERLKRS